MRDLAEESRGDRTIEDEVSIVQRHFFDGLPSSDRGRRGGWLHVRIVIVPPLQRRLVVGVRAIRAVWLKDRSIIVVAIAIVWSRVGIKRIVALRMWRVGLIVISIVVSFWIQRIVSSCRIVRLLLKLALLILAIVGI